MQINYQGAMKHYSTSCVLFQARKDSTGSKHLQTVAEVHVSSISVISQLLWKLLIVPHCFHFQLTALQYILSLCCVRCGPDEARILDAVPREDGARNSG
jgi:hypothetical protein